MCGGWTTRDGRRGVTRLNPNGRCARGDSDASCASGIQIDCSTTPGQGTLSRRRGLPRLERPRAGFGGPKLASLAPGSSPGTRSRPRSRAERRTGRAVRIGDHRRGRDADGVRPVRAPGRRKSWRPSGSRPAPAPRLRQLAEPPPRQPASDPCRGPAGAERPQPGGNPVTRRRGTRSRGPSGGPARRPRVPRSPEPHGRRVGLSPTLFRAPAGGVRPASCSCGRLRDPSRLPPGMCGRRGPTHRDWTAGPHSGRTGGNLRRSKRWPPCSRTSSGMAPRTAR